MKMPPIEKIPEAYSAIVDGRVEMHEDHALVTSSDHSKVYLVKWKENTFYSNDNATYWQGYPGYPVLAVLLLQGRLPYNEDLAKHLKGINWHDLNKKYKRDYHQALEKALENDDHKEAIFTEMDRVYHVLEAMDLTVTRKKNL